MGIKTAITLEILGDDFCNCLTRYGVSTTIDFLCRVHRAEMRDGNQLRAGMIDELLCVIPNFVAFNEFMWGKPIFVVKKK